MAWATHNPWEIGGHRDTLVRASAGLLLGQVVFKLSPIFFTLPSDAVALPRAFFFFFFPSADYSLFSFPCVYTGFTRDPYLHVMPARIRDSRAGNRRGTHGVAHVTNRS